MGRQNHKGDFGGILSCSNYSNSYFERQQQRKIAYKKPSQS